MAQKKLTWRDEKGVSYYGLPSNRLKAFQADIDAVIKNSD